MLVARQANALRIAALDEAAEALGLTLGLPLATARARVPELAVLDADPAADLKLLERVGEACRRYTPALALEPPDGLSLDITGAGRLFGSEKALAADLSARLNRQGFCVRTGRAATLGLAWALARYGGPATGSVKSLPVAALRLDAESVDVLRKLGLRRVGQVLDLPRPALAKRLGEDLLLRLDEALGLRAVALDLVPEPEILHAQHRLAEPVTEADHVLRLCRWLAGRLAARLDGRGAGGRRFALDLFRVDGAIRRLSVEAARPLRDPARIAALFAERLDTLNEGLEADFGFDLLRLIAETVEPLKLAPRDLLGGADDGDFIALIDRLAVRLGPDAVQGLVPNPESRIPEQAVLAVALERKAAQAWADEPGALDGQTPLRPLTLFDPPQAIRAVAGVPEDPPHQFWWRRREHRVVRAEGPERIAWEWWRAKEAEPESETESKVEPEPEPGEIGRPAPPADHTLRDYYRLEDDAGRRFWVFREGAFGGAAPPRWFLHGLFA